MVYNISVFGKMQVMQKASLTTATGGTQDTNIQHLHDKTLTLSIHEHLQWDHRTPPTLPLTRVKGVGRQQQADMADLEIDQEDVHDREKWRKNVMKRNYIYTNGL